MKSVNYQRVYDDFLKELKGSMLSDENSRLYGYAAKMGADSLTGLDETDIPRILVALSHINSNYKHVSSIAGLRNPSVLCTIFLLDKYRDVLDSFDGECLAVVAMHLCSCSKEDFAREFPFLCNNQLIKGIISNFDNAIDQDSACFEIVQKGINNGVNIGDKDELSDFWNKEIENMKANPENYMLTSKKVEELSQYVSNRYFSEGETRGGK